jgi:hypothetical protein
MGPQPLLQFDGISLDPAVEGRVVDRHAPVPQHEFEIAVGDRELQVLAHRPHDHFRRELTTWNGFFLLREKLQQKPARHPQLLDSPVPDGATH